MCGRATVTDPEGIEEKFYGFSKRFIPAGWKPRYNLNPREDIPVVHVDASGDRALRAMHWNFVPGNLSSRDQVVAFDSQYSTFNARVERAATSPTFRSAWRKQRCLVVVDGIFEWVGAKGAKTPHLIRRKDRRPFAMAGLWSRWQDAASGEELWSCTVIVKDADDWYRRFHDRMAVLLDPESHEQWLDPQRKSGQRELISNSAYHKNGELEFFPISKLVNNARNDSPELLSPTP
jgi:putative SOS response-associated peptidase YedK